MRKQVYVFIYLFTFLSCHVFSQESIRYSRVKVYTGENGMQQLNSLGVDVDHGDYKKGYWFISDFSTDDIKIMRENGFSTEILVDDVVDYYQKQNLSPLIKTENTSLPPAGSCNTFNYTTPANFSLGSMGGFFTYSEINAQLDSLKQKFPSLVKSKTALGTQSRQGRNIYWIKISDNADSVENEPEVLYTALHHAREPASASQLIFYMYYLLENYNSNPEVKFLVDNTEMYFIPCVNPDGYAYNQSTNPNGGGLWRKNRRDNGDGTYGVDINRNYGVNWGYDNNGSSPNTNSNTYRGTAAFSEPETRAVRDFCYSRQFKTALNYHTYGNLLINPWGHIANTFTPDSTQYRKYGAFLTDENHFVYGTNNQTVGYQSNGRTDDWMYGDTSQKPKIFSFTPETGNSNDGFWPPQNRIVDICKSNLRLNLNVALLATKYADASDDESYYITTSAGYLKYSLKQLGLDSSGTYVVKIEPLGNTFDSVGSSKSYTAMSLLQEIKDSIPFMLNNNLLNGEYIRYVISVDNGYYITRDTLRKRFGQPVVAFSSSCNSMTSWTSTSWGTSTSAFISSPASITESPGGNYTANANTTVTTKTSINLTNAISARLRFWTTWKIETNRDYIQLQASDDNGNTWVPVCGKYTKSGNTAQDNGNPVYDGFKSEWYREEMILDDFIGKNILLRFRLSSDGGGQYEGFYFDDFIVDKLPVPITTTIINNSGREFSAGPCFPNPAENHVEIPYSVKGHYKDVTLCIYDAYGRKTSETKLDVSGTSLALDMSLLSAGIYFYRIEADEISSPLQKMVIIR